MPDRPAIEDELIRVRTHCVPLVENGEAIRREGVVLAHYELGLAVLFN
tara:strand:+ start:108 stop:251 length:144 start_codon:yes stop_codon:yes gene_type:complete